MVHWATVENEGDRVITIWTDCGVSVSPFAFVQTILKKVTCKHCLAVRK